MNPFEVFLTTPILNLLVAFYRFFDLINIPGALGLSIIFLTVTIRMILWPLTASQLKSGQKMAALKPHLSRLKEEHGHDKLRHQQEVSKLYKEHGVNPLAGCLPLLLQIPVFIALYNVLLKIVDFNKADFLASINDKLYSTVLYLEKIPDTSFIGFNLSSKPSEWQQIGFLILLVPPITGALQFIQSKMMVPVATSKPAKTNEKQGLEDSMAQMQSQMTYLMPAMIAFFSYGFPFGLSLYWNTFTAIGIIQQYLIAGAGGLNRYLPKGLKKESIQQHGQTKP